MSSPPSGVAWTKGCANRDTIHPTDLHWAMGLNQLHVDGVGLGRSRVRKGCKARCLVAASERVLRISRGTHHNQPVVERNTEMHQRLGQLKSAHLRKSQHSTISESLFTCSCCLDLPSRLAFGHLFVTQMVHLDPTSPRLPSASREPSEPMPHSSAPVFRAGRHSSRISWAIFRYRSTGPATPSPNQ